MRTPEICNSFNSFLYKVCRDTFKRYEKFLRSSRLSLLVYSLNEAILFIQTNLAFIKMTFSQLSKALFEVLERKSHFIEDVGLCIRASSDRKLGVEHKGGLVHVA